MWLVVICQIAYKRIINIKNYYLNYYKYKIFIIIFLTKSSHF